MVRSDRNTSTARHSKSFAGHDSADAPVGSPLSETVTGSTFPANTVKQQTDKAKRSKKVKQPKGTAKSLATPPASTTNGYVFHTTFYSPCCSLLFSIEKIAKEIRLKLH